MSDPTTAVPTGGNQHGACRTRRSRTLPPGTVTEGRSEQDDTA
jgi:hypothetical protein